MKLFALPAAWAVKISSDASLSTTGPAKFVDNQTTSITFTHADKTQQMTTNKAAGYLSKLYDGQAKERNAIKHLLGKKLYVFLWEGETPAGAKFLATGELKKHQRKVTKLLIDKSSFKGVDKKITLENGKTYVLTMGFPDISVPLDGETLPSKQLSTVANKLRAFLQHRLPQELTLDFIPISDYHSGKFTYTHGAEESEFISQASQFGKHSKFEGNLVELRIEQESTHQNLQSAEALSAYDGVNGSGKIHGFELTLGQMRNGGVSAAIFHELEDFVEPGSKNANMPTMVVAHKQKQCRGAALVDGLFSEDDRLTLTDHKGAEAKMDEVQKILDEFNPRINFEVFQWVQKQETYETSKTVTLSEAVMRNFGHLMHKNWTFFLQVDKNSPQQLGKKTKHTNFYSVQMLQDGNLNLQTLDQKNAGNVTYNDDNDDDVWYTLAPVVSIQTDEKNVDSVLKEQLKKYWLEDEDDKQPSSSTVLVHAGNDHFLAQLNNGELLKGKDTGFDRESVAPIATNQMVKIFPNFDHKPFKQAHVVQAHKPEEKPSPKPEEKPAPVEPAKDEKKENGAAVVASIALGLSLLL